MKKVKVIGILLLVTLLSFLATPRNVAAGTYNFTINNMDPSRGKVVGPGIDCGSSCATTYNSADTITLTAVPNPGFVVFYWGNGDCDGYPLNGPATNTSNTCVVKNPNNTTPWGATITFAYAAVSVNAHKRGTGDGTITSAEAGINCGNTCSGSVTSGDGVSFRETPAPGSVFSGWYDQYGLFPTRLAYEPTSEVQLDFHNSPDIEIWAQFDKVATAGGTGGSAPPKAPATAPPATNPTPSSTPAPASTPVVSVVKVNDNIQASGKDFAFSSGQAVALEGTTVPNGIVKLFIFSQPRQATVTADSQGRWKYTIQGLEPGSHHVEAEVTDPATHQTSGRTTLTSFKIIAAQTPTILKKQSRGPSVWVWLLVAVCLTGIGGGVWLLRQRASGLYMKAVKWTRLRMRR